MSEHYFAKRLWSDLGYNPAQARAFLVRRMPDKESTLKTILGMGEMARARDLGKAVVAEAIGTLFITYFGCMSCLNIQENPGTTDLVLISLAFGFVVAVSVQVLGHVSGANLNPAVTCGLLITGRVTVVRALLYILAQCVGAVAGAAILKGFTPDSFRATLGTTALGKDMTAQQGLGVEFMLGFLLVLTVFGVIDPHKPDCKFTAPLAIGLAVAVGHLSSIDYTGSSMNPARSLGSAVLSGNWDDHWVYWLGPILGGVVAAVLYATLFAASPPSEYAPVAGGQATEVLVERTG
ncbi:aquaporin AQPcic-like isoform X2 [Cimex lectularius]|uniref:Aquaporin n=2 Tax=Cimex lectularius TaxID=79782 RepID=A0A8I6RR29_CIMLE|nr:aquaporin AQPcic-like isoform X2 [Cimex lectularius]